MQTRVATYEDRNQVWDMLLNFHEECGFYDLNPKKAFAHVCGVIGNGLCILMIDEKTGKLAGTVGLIVDSPWWSSVSRAYDTWFYIDKAFRSLSSFKNLLKCAVVFADKLGCELHIRLYAKGAERKQVLFSKYMKQCMEVYDIRYVGGEFKAKQ